MRFIIPKDFKKGKYYFNKYRIIDLAILIGGCSIGVLISVSMIYITLKSSSMIWAMVGVIVGVLICIVCVLLTTNINYYFNVFEFLLTYIKFHLKDKKYVWLGIDYSYEDNDEEGEIIVSEKRKQRK